MNRSCIECGAAVDPGELWCSRNCEDVWSHPQMTAGYSLVGGVTTSHIGRRANMREDDPPSVAVPGDPIDFDSLPF